MVSEGGLRKPPLYVRAMTAQCYVRHHASEVLPVDWLTWKGVVIPPELRRHNQTDSLMWTTTDSCLI